MFVRSSIAAALASASLVTTAFAQQTFAPNPFTDVPKNSTYYEAIEHLRSKNVLKGYEDGTFKPNARINRAEFVKLIANPYILDTERLNDCITTEMREDDQTVFFPDVRRDSWYASEVCLAKTKQIISGYPDGTFQPGNYVNFVEAAKIIASTFSLQATTDEANEQWYKPYVEKLDELNAIPTSINTFAGPITRGEMAEMLYRLKMKNTTKASQSYGGIR